MWDSLDRRSFIEVEHAVDEMWLCCSVAAAARCQRPALLPRALLLCRPRLLSMPCLNGIKALK